MRFIQWTRWRDIIHPANKHKSGDRTASSCRVQCLLVYGDGIEIVGEGEGSSLHPAFIGKQCEWSLVLKLVIDPFSPWSPWVFPTTPAHSLTAFSFTATHCVFQPTPGAPAPLSAAVVDLLFSYCHLVTRRRRSPNMLPIIVDLKVDVYKGNNEGGRHAAYKVTHFNALKSTKYTQLFQKVEMKASCNMLVEVTSQSPTNQFLSWLK